MSALSPNHSRRGSSTASSTPDNASDVAMDLTPRSKIRKIMSNFDDDDDSDKENRSAISKHDQNNASGTDARRASKPTDDNSSRVLNAGSPHKTFEADQRPLSHHGSDTETNDDQPSNAYERIKRQLARKADQSSAASRPQAAPSATSIHELTSSTPIETSNGKLPVNRSPLRDPNSPSPAPRSSQGSNLFVSPTKAKSDTSALQSAQTTWTETEEESEAPHVTHDRLRELVARKRAEREAREKDAIQDATETDTVSAQSKGPAKKRQNKSAIVTVESENSDSDNEAGKRFTQIARPGRKAGKKAMEEMRRETQRMSRNMQLAHEARTKTKFTTADLFKKMGFRQPKNEAVLQQSSSSAALSSDVEAPQKTRGTPPSSPPSLGGKSPRPVQATSSASQHPTVQVSNPRPDSDDDAPSLEELMRAATSSHPSGQGGHSNQAASESSYKPSVKKFMKTARQMSNADDSDDDLEIIRPHVARALATLDHIPEKQAKESRSMHALRALAHLNERPTRRQNLPKSMTPAALQKLIQLRAREQNLAQMSERRKRMKEKGDFIDDDALAEEQLETHDLIEKARKEDADLAKKEKEAAKREAKANGEEVLASSDEDEDYQASDEEAGQEANTAASEDEEEADYSGSESGDELVAASDDEGVENAASAPVDQGERDIVPFIDDAADEDTNVETSHRAGVDVATASTRSIEPVTPRPRRSNGRRAVVESDDESPNDDVAVPSTARAFAAQTPAKTPADAVAAAFGFNQVQKSPAFGLSQIFGGTMAGSQTQQSGTMHDPQSLPISPMFETDFIQQVPSSTMSPALPGLTQVRGSQPDVTPSRPSNTQIFGVTSPQDDLPAQTQMSEIPAPTQDAGFEAGPTPERVMHPASEPDATSSTVDTVLLDEDAVSPAKAAPRRIQRGRPRLEVVSSQEDPVEIPDDSEEIGSGNAFLVMKHATKKARRREEYIKKHSEAKEMFQEQAEESEDEYAGIGGASDDESAGELDDETRKMIDDVSNEKLNEGKIAERYNEQRLAEDEKQTSKIFKDMTTGAWRRKRGAQDDFFDEDDDEEEAAARRRAAKQREFARMRKALLADEKIGKIANPKREAFLKAIEDFAPDHEMDFLDAPEEGLSQVPATQPDKVESQNSETAGAGSKRSHAETSDAIKADAADSRKRRMKTRSGFPVPDVRRTLSEMIGEPQSLLEGEDHNVDVEDDESDYLQDEDANDQVEDEEHRWTKPATAAASSNPRRTGVNANRKAVIDRMALKRGSSSATSCSDSTDRLAFNSLSRAGSGSFKMPSLLRRATTNASNASDTGVTSGASMNMSMGKEIVKMGGSTKSSVNYYVREQERRAKVEEVERTRKEGNLRVGRMRREAVGLGSLAGGSFE